MFSLLPISLLINSPNASWLRVHNLYSQSMMTVINIFDGWLQPCLWSLIQAWAGPPLAPYLVVTGFTVAARMTKPSQPRVFNVSHFHVVFKCRPSPFLEEIHELVNHTPIYQSIFSTEQLIGASSLSSYPEQRSHLSLYGLYYKIPRGITRLYTGYVMHQTAVREFAKLVCGLPSVTAFQSY